MVTNDKRESKSSVHDILNASDENLTYATCALIGPLDELNFSPAALRRACPRLLLHRVLLTIGLLRLIVLIVIETPSVMVAIV